MISIRNNDTLHGTRLDIFRNPVTGFFTSGKLFRNTQIVPLPGYRYMTAEFVGFEKFLGYGAKQLAYHLCGYGITSGETVASFVGEAAERFSFVASNKLLGDRVQRASRSELLQKVDAGDRVCPLEYINIVYKPDSDHFVTEDTAITWVRMISAQDPSQNVWNPLQFMLPHNETLFGNEPKILPSAVSTGTACHETFPQALENSFIEFLQIDSFNLWWFAGIRAQEMQVDIREKLQAWGFDIASASCFLENFQVTFLDITFDKPFPVFVCEIRSRRDGLPRYSVGVQGGMNLERTLYRAFMECLAVLDFNLNTAWMDPERYRSVTDLKTFTNLDDNVTYYAKFGEVGIARDGTLGTRNSEDFVARAGRITSMKDFEYAGILDITAPDCAGLGVSVTRLIIPELLPMCLPSFPQRLHPRFALAGGVVNDDPHPLA